MRLAIWSFALLLMGCGATGQGDGSLPGNAEDHRPFGEIAADETLYFTGTEPFWGGEVTGDRLLHSTPDTPEPSPILVERFAGRGGISWSGANAGAELLLVATPGACSDGMSDRSYPYRVTLNWAKRPAQAVVGAINKALAGQKTPDFWIKPLRPYRLEQRAFNSNRPLLLVFLVASTKNDNMESPDKSQVIPYYRAML